MIVSKSAKHVGKSALHVTVSTFTARFAQCKMMLRSLRIARLKLPWSLHDSSCELDLWGLTERNVTGLNRLAMTLLQHGDKMSVAQMAKMMQAWVPSTPRYTMLLRDKLLHSERQGTDKTFALH